MKKILLLLIFSQIIAQEALNETIVFESRNPFSFEEVITDLDNQETQIVTGILGFPADFDTEKKYPLIVGVAGSLNWGPHHLKYLEQIRLADFIVFAMHPFDSRNVKSTVGNQINVTSETVIYDMAMSLNLLWEDPRIDNQKIYAAGWSLGGTATLFNAWLPLQKELNLSLIHI